MFDVILSIDINHLITTLLVISISFYIIFNPNEEFNTEEEEWSKRYLENEIYVGLDPVTKLIIPPESYMKKKPMGYINQHFNQFVNAVLNRNSTSTANDSSELDDILLEVPLIKGTFNLHKIPVDNTPVICFVNSNSGSKQGLKMKKLLKCYLNPACQVIDICLMDPQPIIECLLTTFSVENGIVKYKFIKGLVFLVCGGDDTVCWILDCIHKCYQLNPHHDINEKPPHPPVAVLPLGLRNDLSYVLGWGCGVDEYSENELKSKSDHEHMKYDFSTSASEVVGDLIQTSARSVGNSIQSLSHHLLDTNDFVDIHTQLLRISSCDSILTHYRLPCVSMESITPSHSKQVNAYVSSGISKEDDDSLDLNKVTKIAYMDRWKISFDNYNTSTSDKKKAKDHLNSSGWVIKNNIFYKGFSIGIDAQVLYESNNNAPMEEETVSICGSIQDCYSRVFNLKDVSSDAINTNLKLAEYLEIHIEDKKLDIPSFIEGMVFSNIQCYSSGGCAWRLDTDTSGGMRNAQGELTTDPTDDFVEDCYSDGILEIMGIENSLHLSQMEMGLSGCHKIAQVCCKHDIIHSEGTNATGSVHKKMLKSKTIKITTRRPLPMQIDGKAWIQNEGEIVIELSHDKSCVMVFEDIEFEDVQDHLPGNGNSYMQDMVNSSKHPNEPDSFALENENESVHSSMFYTDIEEY